MSPRCDDLDPFFDGELSSTASVAFRDHLAGCERCQRSLRGRMLEAVVVSAPRRDRSPMPDVIAIHPRRRSSTRRVWLTAAAAAVAAAAVAIMWIRPSGSPSETAAREREDSGEQLALQLAPKRGVDVRFSAPSLDQYRPRNIVRNAGASIVREELSLQDLAALERRNALHALVGAHALKGEVASAVSRAARLPRDAASLSDRAALALLEADVQKGQANAERALSLAAEALRLDPRFTQATWNQAVALERLELPRAAAATFDAIATRGEPGWAAEAQARAADLRRRYDEDLAQRRKLEADAEQMRRGGPPMTPAAAEHAPSMARSALHVAIAATADPTRLAELARLAETFGLTPELERIRRSDLARRAPIAKQLAEAAAKPEPTQLRAIRARARAGGLDDIARAISLLIPDDNVTEDDLDELKLLSASEPWWRLVAIERRVFHSTYRTQRYAEADLAARDVIGTCRAEARDHDAFWCPQILRTLAASNSELGRIDRAYELAAEARRIARAAHDRVEEGYALNVTGQIAAARVVGWDPSPVADAYLYESALRTDNCAARLYRLDFGARAALDYHRFTEAERLLGEADRLDEHECADQGVRYNAEEVRLRLIVHGAKHRVDELDRRTRRIEERWGKDLYPDNRLYNEYLRTRARLAVEGGPQSVAALRDVIAKAHQLPGERYPRTIRAHGHGALAEHAARRGAPDEALAAVAERLGVRLEPGCTVGINHGDRVTVVVRGANDRTAAEVLEVPVGRRLLAPAELLSRLMRERLVGCARVDVLATGPYFGAARLLGPEMRWAYRSSPRRATTPQRLDRQVVVTDVEPPAELGFPPLRRMQLPPARVLARAQATPDGVLAAISDAELVVINAHGVTDANEPAAASLVLSPDAKGSYWLTADRVRQARLAGAPVVILAACHAGRVQVTTEPWSLASSFLSAGARAVIAPTTEIEDDTANAVFESIVKRMQSGRSPEQAVADEREAGGHRAPWLADVVVFQ